MASYLTSDTLIDSIKRRAAIPTSQVTFQDADFLAFANEEIAMGILPSILQYHEEFLVYPETIPLEANVSSYAIPYRAIGTKLRHLHYEDSNGNRQELARILPEDVVYYQNGTSDSRVTQFFYLQNNMIVLVPEVGASVSGNLIASYYMRPNQLVASDRIATISAIDTATGVVTVDAVPSEFSVSGTLQPLDFLEVKGGHRTKGFDATPTASTGTTLTFDTDDLPSDLAVGDHIALAGECLIPQIPDDLHVMLAQRVAARCLESLGDTQGLQNANAKLQEMEQKTATLIDNRTEGTPTKAVNLRGPLSRRRIR